MMLNQVLLLCFQVETIRAVLKKELDLPIIEIGDESAKLDGGDVLFTGTDTALVCSSRCVNFQIFIQGRKRNALCGGCVYLWLASLILIGEWIVQRLCIKNSH